MKIFGPYPPDLATLVETLPGNPGNAPADQLLTFVVDEEGDTGRVLPANAFVKYLLMMAKVPQSVSVGIPGDASLFLQKLDRLNDVATTAAPNVWLPQQVSIITEGIESSTRIVIIYSIIPLSYA